MREEEDNQREREICARGERFNKKNKDIFLAFHLIVLLIEHNCSSMLNVRTCDVDSFLVFGVLNAKILAFSTPDVSALIYIVLTSLI